MTDEIIMVVSGLAILALIVLFIISARQRRQQTIRHPQPVHIIFKDPYGLAAEFEYTLTPQRGRDRRWGNWIFKTESGEETPPEHRVAEMDEGKQGDTLLVTWKLKDGTYVRKQRVLSATSAAPLTVTLDGPRTVDFEQAEAQHETVNA